MAAITNDNFIVSSQDFLALIPYCEFYAWDLEMTGIRAPEVPIPASDYPHLKIPKEAFREKITAAKKYDIIQVGVSLFFKDGTMVPDVIGARPDHYHKEALANYRRNSETPDKIGPADEQELVKVHRALNLKRLATDGLHQRRTPALESVLVKVDTMLKNNETNAEAVNAAMEIVEVAIMVIRKEASELGKLREEHGVKVKPLIEADDLTHEESNFIMSYFEDLRIQNAQFQSFCELCAVLQRLQGLKDGNGVKWRSLTDRVEFVPIEGRKKMAEELTLVGGSSSSAAVEGSNVPAGYTVRAFSMYVFPNAELEPTRDIMLNGETCGIFLTNNSPIDFNHWIRDGARYVTRETMSKMRLDTLQTYDIGAKPKSAMVPRDLSDSDADIFTRIAKRFEDGDNTVTPGFLSPELFKHIARYAGSLGYKKDGKSWSRGANIMTAAGGGGSGKPLPPTPFEVAGGKKYGASCLIEALISSRKPCVIHNGLSDLAFLLAKFHQNVPNSYGGFKALVSACFPVIFDTRTLTTLECFSHIVNRGRMDKTYDNFIRKYGNQVIDVHVPSTGYELLTQGAHDAAADAFKTGKLYLIAKYGLETEEANNGTTVDAFRNIVPVYECIFSVHFGMDADCYVAKSSSTPVWILTTAERLFNRFDSICGKFLNEFNIPTTPMGGPNTDTLLFSDSRASVFSRPTPDDDYEVLRAKVEMLMRSLFKTAKVTRLNVEGVLKKRASDVIVYWPSPVTQ